VSDQPSNAVQDYLKAIHRLGGTDRLVMPVEIANHLQVRSPSVTGMLKRLSEAAYIEYESGTGAKLTSTGLREALRVIRRHRLVELFLTRVLGLDWSEVDTEAELLEHAISPRLEEALAKYLGEPEEDPHGHIIPTSEGQLRQRALKKLSEMTQGQTAVIREVQDDNPARLRRWSELGLIPGVEVHLFAHQALDDIFELKVGHETIRVGSEGLSGLRGEFLAEPKNPETA
jgi:DtxR family transcriptional regulator, Mn-dependent transcriptional regulator